MPASNHLDYHDHECAAAFAYLAKRLALVGILFLLGTLLQYPDKRDDALLVFAASLLLVAWRLWKLARSPCLVLKADHLVLQKFFRRHTVRYDDIAAIALQSGMTPTRNLLSLNRRTGERHIEKLYLKLRNRLLLDRELPAHTGLSVISAIRSKTGLKETCINGAGDLAQWRKTLAIT